MSDTKTTASKCPACGTFLDAAATPDPKSKVTPKPGDFSLCIKCACILVFADDMSVRLPSPQALAELTRPQMARLEELQKKIRLVNEGKTYKR